MDSIGIVVGHDWVRRDFIAADWGSNCARRSAIGVLFEGCLPARQLTDPGRSTLALTGPCFRRGRDRRNRGIDRTNLLDSR